MARKRKVVTPEVAPAVEQEVAQKVEEQVVVVAKPTNTSYKCLECGNVNEERSCKKCGGSILRKV